MEANYYVEVRALSILISVYSLYVYSWGKRGDKVIGL
jgi:hypothetical protein